MKMIVIGNGPIEGKKGAEIDKFDIVVRMSHFKTKGYEEICGSKTDVWAVSNLWDTTGREDIPIIWCANPGGIYGVPFNKVQEHYGKGKVRCPSQESVNELYTALGYDKNPHKHPTLGLFTISMAIEAAHFLFETVAITGFTFNKEYFNTGKCKFYFDTDTPPAHKADGHDYDSERNLVDTLVKGGLLRWI